MQDYRFDKVKVLVFDFDGTLVETMDGFADLAAELIEKYHKISWKLARAQYLQTSGIPFFQQLEIINPGAKANAACADEFETLKLKGFFDVAPSHETTLGLSILRNAGYHLVVSSNNFQTNLNEYLKIHRLPLDMSLGYDGCGLEKGRTHFMEVQKHFGVTCEDLLFCGDSIQDGEKAAVCGVPFIGKLGTFGHEQFMTRFPGIITVDNILDLAKKIRSKLKIKHVGLRESLRPKEGSLKHV